MIIYSQGKYEIHNVSIKSVSVMATSFHIYKPCMNYMTAQVMKTLTSVPCIMINDDLDKGSVSSIAGKL